MEIPRILRTRAEDTPSRCCLAQGAGLAQGADRFLRAHGHEQRDEITTSSTFVVQ